MEDFWFGYGAGWLDLLTTKRMRRRPPEREYLTDPAALRRWLRAVGLDPRRAPGPDDVVAAIRLREALYALARAALDGARPPAPAVAVVNAALGSDRPPKVGARSDGLALPRPPDTDTALGWLARDAVGVLTGPGRDRLRACSDESCGGIFLDESGRRRWCSDTRCGSRARVRAHRARSRGQ